MAAINGARASAGLPALLEDPVLDRSAAEWSRFLASGQSLTHGDFNARISALYPGQAAGEDIAEGQPTPEAVVAAWMASPPHRANILGDFNRAGVGSSEDTRGSIYWCAEFVRAT